MPKKSIAKTPRLFQWDPHTESWSAMTSQRTVNVFKLKALHHKTVQGRPWTVYMHPDNASYLGRWTDNGPDVPPYG